MKDLIIDYLLTSGEECTLNDISSFFGKSKKVINNQLLKLKAKNCVVKIGNTWMLNNKEVK